MEFFCVINIFRGFRLQQILMKSQDQSSWNRRNPLWKCSYIFFLLDSSGYKVDQFHTQLDFTPLRIRHHAFQFAGLAGSTKTLSLVLHHL